MSRSFTLVMGLLFLTNPLIAGPLGEVEFLDRPVEEILLVLSAGLDTPVMPDETVTGRGSFYYPGGTSEEALELFLQRHLLYLVNTPGGHRVSRIRIETTGNGGLTIDGQDVSLGSLVSRLSQSLGITILHDELPVNSQTVHLAAGSPQEALEILFSPFPRYQVSTMKAGPGGVIRIDGGGSASAPGGGFYFSGRMELLEGLYRIRVERGSFRQVMERFLALSGGEAVFLGHMNPLIENLTLKDRDYEECLNLLMALGSSSFREIDEILHIYDVDRDKVLGRYVARETVPFFYRQAGDVLPLIPPDLLPSGGITADVDRNSLLLWGFDEEVSRLKELLLVLDAPREDLEYREYLLRFRRWEEIKPLLPETLVSADVISLARGTGVLAGLSRKQQEDFREFIDTVDRPDPVHPVNLRFIKAEDLLNSPPPGFSSSDLEGSGDSSLVYFSGSRERYLLLLEALEGWDKPQPQIRYDLLVIEYAREKQTSWDFSISNSVLQAGDQPSYLGALGNLLALNFDIPSAFGYAFSLKLNADINHARARVLVDTSLCALSGQEVRFQNSNTYRYRDTVKDLETGSQEATGVSREITSGLFINIEGWVSGAEMITMDVSTTVSKRGDISSEATGILPPTSEKVIKTHIRTAAGQPVVIGGLVQREAGVVEGKNPLLGWVPLLGDLFQRRQGTEKNTEMVVYIIPHLEFYQDGGGNDNLERLYEKYGYLFP